MARAARKKRLRKPEDSVGKGVVEDANKSCGPIAAARCMYPQTRASTDGGPAGETAGVALMQTHTRAVKKETLFAFEELLLARMLMKTSQLLPTPSIIDPSFWAEDFLET